jgi:hypothetical protein
MSRIRFVEPSVQLIEGRAWSGCAGITRVEFSTDGGLSWTDTSVEDQVSPYAWRRWTHRWDATAPGGYVLCARATDADGNAQPVEQAWNLEGVENNAVQRVPVVVGPPAPKQPPADSL